MSDFSSQYDNSNANPNLNLLQQQKEAERTELEQQQLEQGTGIAADAVANQVQTQNNRQVNNPGDATPEHNWNRWNLAATVTGGSFVPEPPKTLEQKKAESMARVQRIKDLVKAGSSEEQEALLAESAAASPYNRLEAIGTANADATFDTRSFSGAAGDVALRALKSVTDIIDEDIVGKGDINNISQQNAAYTRQLNNEAQRTSEKLTSAGSDFAQGNQVAGAWKAMGALVEMGGIMGSSLWDNPTQVIDMLADSAAFFVGGGVGAAVRVFGAARDVSYALGVAKQGVQDFQKANNRNPEGEELGRILVAAGVSGILARASATVLQGQGGMILKRPLNAVMDSTANATRAAVQKSITSVAGRTIANTGIGLAGVAGVLGRDAAIEGAQEIAQEYLETNFAQDKDLDVNDARRLVEAGVSGAAMGGTLGVPRGAIEAAGTYKNSAKNMSALDLQDAKVNTLLKRSEKGAESLTPESRQSLYAEALAEQAKADKQAETVQEQTTQLEQTLRQYTTPVSAKDDEENSKLAAERTELQSNIESINKQIAAVSGTDNPTVTVDGLGKVSVATAEAAVVSMENTLDGLAEPVAALTPEQNKQQQVINMLSPKDKDKAITVITNAINKNKNSLKQYERTKASAAKLSAKFNITEEQRIASDSEANELKAQRKQADADKKMYDAKRAEAAAKGEAEPKFDFAPSVTDSTSKYADTKQATAQEEAALLAEVGESVKTVRDKDTEAEAWDAREPGESTNQAIARMLREYESLPAGESTAATTVLTKMIAMVDADNNAAVNAFRTSEDAVAAAKAVYSKLEHYSTGNHENTVTAEDYEAALDSAPAELRPQLAKGIYNSIANGPEDKFSAYLAKAKPEHIAKLGADLTPEALEHLQSLAAFHKAIAKTVDVVSNEIVSTGYDGEGHTGERMSVTQHGIAIQNALNANDQESARAAFVRFEEWARNHLDVRSEWIKLLIDKGYADSQATKGTFTKEERKKFPKTPSKGFLEALQKEDAIFRETLAAQYKSLENKTGIEEWWVNSLERNNADDTYIRTANSKSKEDSYSIFDATREPEDADIAWKDRSAGQKAHVRKSRNLLRYMGEFLKKSKLIKLFNSENNLIKRSLTPDLDITDVEGFVLLGDNNNMSQDQADSWSKFLDFHEMFTESWSKVVVAGKSNNDLISNFYGTDGKQMDPNIQSIIAASVYDYLATQGSSTLHTTEEDMDKMFGTKSSGISVSDRARLLADINGKGIPRAAWMQELGLGAMRNLKLRIKHEGAPDKAELALATAIGHAALNTLLDTGLIKQSKVEIAKKHKGFSKVVKTPTVTLVAVDSYKGKPTQRIADYMSTYKGDGNVLKMLGSNESKAKELYTSAEDIPVHTHTMDNNSKLSTEKNGKLGAQELLVAANSIPRKFKSKWFAILPNIGLATLKILDGFVTDISQINIGERMNIQSTNNQIEGNFENILDHMNLAGEGNWYVNHTPTSTTRINVEGYGNYLDNKWVRMAMENAEPTMNTVDKTNPDELASLHAGLVSYMKGSDKHRIKEGNTTPELTMQTATPEMRATLIQDATDYLEKAGVFDLMDTAEQRGLSTQEETKLTEALLEFQDKFKTEKGAELLETVFGLQELRDGMASNQDVFTTTFTAEADGTSNGVFLTLVQMGVFKTVEEAAAGLERYGVTIKGFTGSDAVTQSDIYQYIGNERVAARQQAIAYVEGSSEDTTKLQDIEREAQLAMDSFIGPAAARNTNKPHTLTTIYSMGIQGQFAEIAKLLESKIVSELTAIANAGDETTRERKLEDLGNRINSISRAVSASPNDYENVPVHKMFTGLGEDKSTWTIDNLLKAELSTTYGNKLEQYAYDVEGVYLAAALKTVFGRFPENSAALNNIGNSIFLVSQNARKMLESQALDAALEAGDISDFEYAEGMLPQKYVKQVDDKQRELNLAGHMPSAQSTAGEYATYMPVGTREITVNHKMNHVQGFGSLTKGSVIGALDEEWVGPGAGLGPRATHSADAYPMYRRMADGALGIHDAIAGPTPAVVYHSGEYNKDVPELLKRYSHINEASAQLDAMLVATEKLSRSLDNLAGGEVNRELMASVYRKVLNAAYPKSSEVIANMDYDMLLEATNSYRTELRMEAEQRTKITKAIFNHTQSLNQMKLSEHTSHVVSGKVESLEDSEPVELDTVPSIGQLTVGADNSVGSTYTVLLQRTINNLLAAGRKTVGKAELDSSNSDAEVSAAEVAQAGLEIQWLADLGKEVKRVIGQGNVVRELRKNKEYSVLAHINKVLEQAYEQATVLLPKERVRSLTTELSQRVNEAATDYSSIGYADIANAIDATSDEATQRENTNTRIYAESDALAAKFAEAEAEVSAIDTIIRESKLVVRETHKQSVATSIFADLLAGVTNVGTLGDLFKIGLDIDKNKDLTSMAKSMQKNARKRLPKHTRIALETIADAGARMYVQVGGKEFKDVDGTVKRNVNPRLASEPFIIRGNTIEIAPPSFAHSPFSNPNNMTRLAAALQLSTLNRGDGVLNTEAARIAVGDLALMLDMPTAPTTNVSGWIKDVFTKYLTDVAYAEKFMGHNSLNGKRALGVLASALGGGFNIANLGANTNMKSAELVWNEETADTDSTVDESDTEQSTPNTLATGRYQSSGKDTVTMADTYDTIESADVVSTLNMLGETYGKDSDEHVAHLTGLMGTLSKFMDKISLGVANVTGSVQEGLYDNGRITLNLFKAKQATATSKLVASGRVQSAQELYSHEMVHAVTGFALDNSSALYREADSLWQEVRDAKNKDDKPLFDYTLFMPAGMDANTGRKEDVVMANYVKTYIFDHIFGVKDRGDGKSNHVAEFIAYGNTNARFREALANFEKNRVIDKKEESAETYFTKFKRIFNKAVDFVTRKSDTSDEALLQRFDALTVRLAANDAQHKGALMQAADMAANGAGKAFRSTAIAVSLAMSTMGAGMQYVPVDAVQNAGKLVSMIAKGNVEGIKDGLDKGYDLINKNNHNWHASMISETAGRRVYELATRRDIRRITAASDAMRQNIQDSIASAINNSFVKPLEDWGVSDQRTMTNALLRTDMAALAYTNNNINSLNLDLVSDLLSDPSMVDNKIASLTTELKSLTHLSDAQRNFYVRNARALGAYMATGKVVDDLLLNNATAIALEHGTQNAMAATAANIASNGPAISIIDQLGSLYALRYTDLADRQRAAEIVKEERQGVAMLMSAHHANKVDSHDEQFKDSPTLLLKGYFPDDTAKNVELRLAPKSDEELYTKQGWKVNAPLVRDKADHVHSDMQYYTRRTIGETYNKGGFDLTTMAARGITGTKISTMSPEQAAALGAQNAVAVAQRSKLVNNMYRPTNSAVLTDADIVSGNIPNRMAPTLDTYGNIVEYKYLIPAAIKDSTLMRDVNPANILAKAHGQTKQRSGLVKTTTPLVSTLKQVYDNLSESKKRTVVEISPNSTDARGLEAYRMLPKYIKDEIRNVWGTDKMYVPAAMMDSVFGNRALSMEAWLREPKVAKGLSELTHTALKGMFGPNAAYGAGYVQETIKSLVRQSASAIVVKSLPVLYANIVSNSAVLVGLGMKPSDILHYYREALPETIRYQRDTEAAFAIDMQISAMSYGDRFTKGEELEQRRARIADSLARNPMHNLMEAGAYVNIATQLGVSNSSIQDDPKWIENIKEARGKYLSDAANSTINETLLTEDSKLYRAAVIGAQMSDFAARYALVSYLTKQGVKDTATGKTKRYSQGDAIDTAMDVFVDFAGATSPELQLANDFGFVMFSKYRLRVMNSMMAAAEINPKGAIGLGLMDAISQAAGLADGFTPATGSMGMTGLLSSVTNPVDVISHIADNTLISYAKPLID